MIIHLRRRTSSLSIAQVAGGSQRPAASSGASLEGLGHLQRWHDLIAARPAVVREKAVPPKDDHPDESKRIEGVRKLLI